MITWTKERKKLFNDHANFSGAHKQNFLLVVKFPKIEKYQVPFPIGDF